MRAPIWMAAALIAALPGLAMAQDKAKTLADLRAELTRLAQDIQGLRAELVASGPEGMRAAGGVTALDRLNSMEAALAQLTGQTEALGKRIDRVVTDGTNRIGDLEFRLCEMQEGCDLGALGDTPPLGQPGAGAAPDALSTPTPAASTPAPSNPATPATEAPSPAAAGAAAAAAAVAGAAGPAEMGVTPPPKPATPATPTPATGAPLQAGEQAEIDRAREVLGQGDFRGAADRFAAFAAAHPQSPLIGEARYLQGQALAGAGETKAAAEVWLDAFSGDPDGPRAAASLLALGRALGELGSTDAACLSLAEVGTRFPASPEAGQAATARGALTCD